MTIFTDRPDYVQTWPEVQAPLSEVLGARAEEQFITSPVPSLFRIVGRQFDRSGLIAAEEARKRISNLNLKLTVPDAGITEAALEDLIDKKQNEIRRNDILSRGPPGFWPGVANFATALAITGIDPLNVGSAFIPVVGPTRYAAMVGGATGAVGRASVRAGVGALEGAVGAAVVEPIVLTAAQLEQADYSVSNSLMNIALGSVLGGGLHVTIGGVRDKMSRVLQEQVSRETLAANLRASVAQAVTGRQIDVGPIMRADAQVPDIGVRLSEIQLNEIRADARRAAAASETARARIAKELDTIQRETPRLEERELRAGALRAEAEPIRTELEAVQARIAEAKEANVLRDQRLEAINKELEEVIPAARRQALQQERELVEAVPIEDTASLEQEARALRRALAARERTAKGLEERLTARQAEIEKRAASAAAREADNLNRLKAREEASIVLARKSITAFARELYGVPLAKSDAEDLAEYLIRSNDKDAVRGITEALTVLLPRRQVSSPTANAADSFLPERQRLYDGNLVAEGEARLAEVPKEHTEAELTQSMNDKMSEAKALASALGAPKLVDMEMLQYDDLIETGKAYSKAVKAAADCQLRRGA